MTNPNYNIIDDIGILYELSLSIGDSINFMDNCNVFLTKFLSRKNFSFASVWLKDENRHDKYNLSFKMPKYFETGKNISLRSDIYFKLKTNKYVEIFAGHELYDNLNINDEFNSGSFYIFLMEETGLIILYSQTPRNSLSYVEVSQFITLFNKFSISIQGSISHSKLLEEISEKETNIEKIVTANKETEKALKLKQKFIDHLSHEIKTPMNAIMGFCHLLFDTDLNVDQKKLLEIIYNSSENLLGIVNDIVDYSKITENSFVLNKSEFSLRKLLHQINNTLVFAAEEKNLSLKYSVECEKLDILIGDKSRLNQIIVNLLSNAIKYTNEGEVTFSASLEDILGSSAVLVFNVQDTGSGIEQEKLITLFDSYEHMSDDTKLKDVGVGLGLPIVKGLVEGMNGIISVESTLGSGTKFTVKIPVDLPPDQQAQLDDSGLDRTADTVPKERISILIVEDNKMNQIYTQKILKKYNIDSDVANDGVEAVEKTLVRNYDMILMDISMPRKDGFSATKEIRHNRSNRNFLTPIIALTADTYNSIKDDLLNSGINDYLSKPIHPAKLLAKLSKWAYNYHQEY